MNESFAGSTRSRWLAISVAAALFLIAYVLIGPILTINAISAAADRGDATALRKHVDFESVRSQLKADMAAQMLKDSSSNADDAWGAFGQMLGALMVDQMVDAFVTPEGIAAMLQGKHPGTDWQGAVPPTKRERHFLLRDDVRWGFASMSSFYMAHEEPDSQVDVMFSREGLNWKLTSIRWRERG